MVGCSSRKTGAQGKLQNLFAKALVLEDESRARRTIITLGLIGARKFLRMAVECVALLITLKKYGRIPATAVETGLIANPKANADSLTAAIDYVSIN